MPENIKELDFELVERIGRLRNANQILEMKIKYIPRLTDYFKETYIKLLLQKGANVDEQLAIMDKIQKSLEDWPYFRDEYPLYFEDIRYRLEVEEELVESDLEIFIYDYALNNAPECSDVVKKNALFGDWFVVDKYTIYNWVTKENYNVGDWTQANVEKQVVDLASMGFTHKDNQIWDFMDALNETEGFCLTSSAWEDLEDNDAPYSPKNPQKREEYFARRAELINIFETQMYGERAKKVTVAKDETENAPEDALKKAYKRIEELEHQVEELKANQIEEGAQFIITSGDCVLGNMYYCDEEEYERIERYNQLSEAGFCPESLSQEDQVKVLALINKSNQIPQSEITKMICAETLYEAVKDLDPHTQLVMKAVIWQLFEGSKICPETRDKINSLGTLSYQKKTHERIAEGLEQTAMAASQAASRPSTIVMDQHNHGVLPDGTPLGLLQ